MEELLKLYSGSPCSGRIEEEEEGRGEQEMTDRTGNNHCWVGTVRR